MIGLPLLLLSVLLLVVGTVVYSAARMTQNKALAANTLRVGLVWAIAYSSLLIGASTSSKEKVLEFGERKTFCGLYFDCHLGISVKRVAFAESLQLDGSNWSTNGHYLLVDVEVTSDADAGTLVLHDPSVRVVDANGRTYWRQFGLERFVALDRRQPRSLSEPIPGPGGFTKTLVFDVPADATDFKLLATRGAFVERLGELLLIGDDDSFLHRSVTLRL